jgi:putative ABC transport system permease protein
MSEMDSQRAAGHRKALTKGYRGDGHRRDSMSMVGLVAGNIWAKKARSIGLAFAVAIAVMTVVTLSAVSSSLESSAAAVLTIGKADFTVAQKGVSDIITSSIDDTQAARVKATPGVRSSVGVLVYFEKLSPSNPLFLEVGIPPSDLTSFGVQVLAGHSFAPDATHQVMLGWKAAQNFGDHVGSRFHTNGTTYTVVGIYSTGISFADLGAMFPLPTLQAYNRSAGSVTLIFVKTDSGYSIPRVESQITRTNPELTTIRTETQFGRADRNLQFLEAAATGSTVLAIAIGAIIVGNAMLLSLFERTREFGLLRAVGWSRRRLVDLMLGEGLLLGLIGVAVGVGLSFMAVTILETLPDLRGVLNTTFTASTITRGLYTGIGMTMVGTLYPAIRAAFLEPLRALSHE